MKSAKSVSWLKKHFNKSPTNILETLKRQPMSTYKCSEEFPFYTCSDNFQYFHCCSGRDRGFGIFSIISHYHDCPGTHSHRHKTATSIPAKFPPIWDIPTNFTYLWSQKRFGSKGWSPKNCFLRKFSYPGGPPPPGHNWTILPHSAVLCKN